MSDLAKARQEVSESPKHVSAAKQLDHVQQHLHAIEVILLQQQRYHVLPVFGSHTSKVARPMANRLPPITSSKELMLRQTPPNASVHIHMQSDPQLSEQTSKTQQACLSTVR